MAYIDKKSAIDALKAIRYGLWEIDIPSPTVPEYVEHHEQIKNMMEITDGWIKKLEEQPTADVVERRRGRWIQRSDTPFYYYCSNCHRVISATSVDQIEKFHAFCGTCGSDMREGDAE